MTVVTNMSPQSTTPPWSRPVRPQFRYLSASDLFRDILTADEIEAHGRTITVQSCKAGHAFYSPGQVGDVLFIIKRGAAQIYRMSHEGRKLVIARLEPMSFFGEMSCIGQGMYDSFAEATEDSLICTMGRADLERLILSRPRIALRLLESMSQRMVAIEQQLEEAIFKGLVPRIAGLLLREARNDAVLGFSHQDLADRLGIYRETATTALNELKAAGVVDIGRRRITILDRSRLERVAAD